MQNSFYIEQFRDIRHQPGRVMNGPCNPIEKLPAALKLTANAERLHTVAVFKIKLKPHVVTAYWDDNLNATIVK